MALVDIQAETVASRGAGSDVEDREEQSAEEPLGSGHASAEIALSLVLASRHIGHAFPTYVTPRVFLAIWQRDASGDEIEGTRVQAVIGREIDFASSPWGEVFDTRVAPGESVRLDYVEPRRADAVAVLARVTVDPDYHYRGVYEAILPGLRSPEARNLIEQALGRARRSVYTLWEEDHALGR